MKKSILIGVLAASLIPSVRAQTAPAPATPAAPATTTAPAAPDAPVVGIAALTVTGALDYESEYVFRGKKITGEAFQPNFDMGYKISDAAGSAHVYWWTSQPIGRAGNGPTNAGPNQNNEIDLGGYYDYPTDAIGLASGTLEAGYQYYWYPNWGGTAGHLSRNQEVHIALQYDGTDTMKQFNVNPQLYYYHDFILDSNTLVFSISQSYAMDDWIHVAGFTLKPSANIGWTGLHRALGDQIPVNTPNWRDSYVFWGLNLELDYKLSAWCTAFARLEYSGNNDGTTGAGALTANGNPQSPGTANSIWAGFGLSFGM
jgi:hypothetical protein